MSDEREIVKEIIDRWAAKASQFAKDSHPAGKCRWCLSEVESGATFCQAEVGANSCHNYWKANEARKKRAGLA